MPSSKAFRRHFLGFCRNICPQGHHVSTPTADCFKSPLAIDADIDEVSFPPEVKLPAVQQQELLNDTPSGKVFLAVEARD